VFCFAAILKDADLTTMSAKKVRQQIEEKLDVDLTDR
jgi:upstream activation factor subunit UAF30